MAGRKKTHVASGNRTRSRSPTRGKQASKPATKGGKQQQAKTATVPTEEDEAEPSAKDLRPAQTRAHQQRLLGTFQGTFDGVLTSGNFNAVLQEVKSALFKRDFVTAFGKAEYLEAYAARWSPTRALCYASALDGISDHLKILCPWAEHIDDAPHQDDGDADKADDKHDNVATMKVLAIGGAAAELVAFTSYLSGQPSGLLGAITLVDVAPWTGVVEKLRMGLKRPPPQSKYVSAALKAANTPVNEPDRLLEVVFKEQDVFGLDRDGLAALVPAGGPVLATLLFTLNELFTGGGIGKTTTFLLNLTSSLPIGSLLLVIDSPGSYSETTLGKEAKRYPMAWLLDKILQDAANEEDDDSEKWEKIESKDSAWFRLGNELRYAIPLEDMRYQMHLYRKGPGSGVEEDREDDDEDEA